MTFLSYARYTHAQVAVCNIVTQDWLKLYVMNFRWVWQNMHIYSNRQHAHDPPNAHCF